MGGLANWPAAALVPLFVAVAAGALGFAPLLGTRLLRRADAAERHEAALELLKCVGPLVAIFISFSLVQAMAEFRRAEAAVQHEAGDMLQLDRALAVTEGTGTARALLRRYVHAVVELEFPAMRGGGSEHPAAASAFEALQTEIERLVRAADSDRQGPAQLLKSTDDLHDDRSGRLGAARGGLPGSVALTTYGLFLLLCVGAAGLRPTRNWMLLAGFYGGALASLAACLFLLDGAYQGDVSVGPEALRHAARLLDARRL